MFQQLISPDPTIKETAGWCLRFTERSFRLIRVDSNGNSVPLVPGVVVRSTAWSDWLATKYKHQDRSFPEGVAVPVWFDWIGDVGEGRHRYGHVAYRGTDGRIYSSPLTGVGRADFANVDELCRAFASGMSYVGWSEDIAGVRVITKGDDMVTREQYMQGAKAVGTEFGKDFNFDPNRSLDQFVQFLDSQAPRIQAWQESELADKITGVKNVIGKDYNSPFVGQRVVTHYPKMVDYWISQRRESGFKPLDKTVYVKE